MSAEVGVYIRALPLSQTDTTGAGVAIKSRSVHRLWEWPLDMEEEGGISRGGCTRPSVAFGVG